MSALIGLVALIGGLLGIAQRSASYEATAKMLVVPRTADEGLAINAADTLSRGPVASTFAEVYSSSKVIDEALTTAGFDDSEAGQVFVSTTLVTDTSVILVSGLSGSPVLAERAADAVARSTPELGGYTRAFRVEQIGTAAGSASRTGASGLTLALIAVIVAGVLGLVTAAVLGRVFPFPPESQDGSGLSERGTPVRSRTMRPRARRSS
jgi:capsular polysaccharide biosynthesis protein